MFRVFQSSSAAERIAAANEFVGSFPAATELLLVGASREAVDDLVREFALKARATFGLHRFTFTQLAARLSLGRLAGAGIAPASARFRARGSCQYPRLASGQNPATRAERTRRIRSGQCCTP